MSTGTATPVKPESEGFYLKYDFFCLFCYFFKHAVNFCEVTYTYGHHFICYDDAKYIDIWGNNRFSIFI